MIPLHQFAFFKKKKSILGCFAGFVAASHLFSVAVIISAYTSLVQIEELAVFWITTCNQ